jgi:16S rRNA (cytidine1402-2'-O)-methyltransferase
MVPQYFWMLTMTGTLFIVSTPIGNLKDITLRAIEVLGAADFVIAENRARALKLLSHLGIRKNIVTINSFDEERKAPAIALRIAKGSSGALITGAGTPCVSDPGSAVVRACREANAPVESVPGPSAVTAAFAISGLRADKFLFFGFLPQRQGKKRRALKELSQFPYPVVLYESPRRLLETLRVIAEEIGDRPLVVLKELTKIHEEVMKDSAAALVERLGLREQKGEYTVIIDARDRQELLEEARSQRRKFVERTGKG